MALSPQFDWHEMLSKFNDLCGYTMKYMGVTGRSGGTTMPPDERWVQHRDTSTVVSQPWNKIRPDGRSTLLIYGCLIYSFQGSQFPPPMTTFLYELGIKDPNDDVSILPFDLTHPQVLGVDDLRISHQYFGTKAN